MKVFELIPTNGRKSFYGKCKVIETDQDYKLLSYNTIVAEYNKGTKQFKESEGYQKSNTTSSHLKAFKQFLNL